MKPSTLDIGLDALRSGASARFTPLQRLRQLLALERSDVWVITIYVVAIGLTSLSVPIAAQALVTTVAATALLQPIVVLSLLVFAGLLGAGVLRTLQYRVVETLAQRFFVRAAYDASHRLRYLNLNSTVTSKHPPTTHAVTRFLEVATIQKTGIALLIDGLSVILQGGVSLVLLAFYHPLLLAFDVVLIVFILFILFALGRDGIATAVKESKAKYSMLDWLLEMATIPTTLKLSSARTIATLRTDDLARAYVVARNKHFKILLRQIFASHLLQASATAVLLSVGGWLVLKNELTLGQLVAAELIVTGVLVSVAKLGKHLESFYDLNASIDKIGDLIDIDVDLEVEKPLISSDLDSPSDNRGDYGAGKNAETLSFSGLLIPASDASTEFDLKLRQGDVTAICFKPQHTSIRRSLIDVFQRHPTAANPDDSESHSHRRGVLALCGVDASAYAKADWRRRVAYVGAAGEAISASVIDNISLGMPEDSADGAGGQRLLLSLLDKLSLSTGIARLKEHTLLITLVRALVAKPTTLILDLSLDTFDVERAREIVQAIQTASPLISVIVLTEREEIRALGTSTFTVDQRHQSVEIQKRNG